MSELLNHLNGDSLDLQLLVIFAGNGWVVRVQGDKFEARLAAAAILPEHGFSIGHSDNVGRRGGFDLRVDNDDIGFFKPRRHRVVFDFQRKGRI